MRANVFMALLLAAAAAAGSEAGVNGVWKTAENDAGGYLEVTVAACDSDAALTCGTITSAFTASGPDPDYQYLGRPIVWDMSTANGQRFAGGKIWDPEDDKTYSSKMQLNGDELDVKGCIAFVCSGQAWTRVR